jgi:two-component system alkaline phosphatase synthesis response regulator PhoP
MDIIFIYNDEKIKKIVLEQLHSGYPAVQVRTWKPDEKTSFITDNLLMAIVDISSLRGIKKTGLVEPIRKIIKNMVPVLIIADSNQKEMVYELLANPEKSGDFILKDNVPQELLLRAKLILRKTENQISENSITVGDLMLDLDKYELRIGGSKIELTFKEYELLKLLLENQNKVFSRNKLLSTIWEYDFYGGSRTVDVHMRRLRSKLKLPYSDMLKTVRNVGYMFSQ